MAKKLPLEGILLVSDMDRTLITDEFKVPERNIKAINRFIENGGLFAVATGRIETSAEKYLDRVKINAPCILSNGTVIFDFSTRKRLWSANLPKLAETFLKEVTEKFPDVGAEVYCEDEIYIINNTEWTERHIVNENFKYTAADINDVPSGWQKFLFAGENARLKEIEKYVSKKNHKGMSFVFSNFMYFEVLPEGVSKGTTLKILANLLGIEKSNIVSIGDFYNDLTLVSMAGFGATVKGAPEELCKEAKFISGPCENGAVADLIEYIEKQHI